MQYLSIHTTKKSSCPSVFEKRRYRSPMAALCKAPTKSAGIGLSITVVCKNAGKKTLGQDDFFVVFKVRVTRITIWSTQQDQTQIQSKPNQDKS